MNSKETTPILLIGALGFGAYAQHNAMNNIENGQKVEVHHKQEVHAGNNAAISEISKVLTSGIVTKCKQEVQACLDGIATPEICRDSTVPAVTLHTLYGQKGVNEAFSIEATKCYLEIDKYVTKCEDQQLNCLESNAPIQKQKIGQ